MARRKSKGASFAKRKSESSQVKMQGQQQRTTILYTLAGIGAFLLLCFLLYLMSRPGSNGQEGSATQTELEPFGSSSEDDRALASVAPAERNGYYDGLPEQTIDESKTYEAVLATSQGDIRIKLFAEEAPVTVNNFVYLADQGFYDGTTFHRVISGFMAQAGDPTGTGTGGPGYKFQDETDNGLEFNRSGLLAMANSGPNTNGSQFFITYGPTAHLNGLHTIFGEVIEGEDALNAIRLRDPSRDPEPGDLIESVDIFVGE